MKPATTATRAGSTSCWGIGESPLGGGRAAAALGRRQHAGELGAEIGEPVRDLAIVAASLEQLVGDRQGREDGGLVGLDHRQRIAHALEGSVEIGRDLARVLRWELGADGELLAA